MSSFTPKQLIDKQTTRNGEQVPERSQEEIDQIKTQRKAERKERIRLAKEYQNRPIPPWTPADKVGMAIVLFLALVVCIGFILISG